jgi:murein L,D-transpeptidase YafK
MKALARIFAALVLLLALALAGLWYTQKPRQLPPVPPPLTGEIDRILVEKSARRLTVFRGDQAVKTYHIALGKAPLGPKLSQGDNRTPEGIFSIDRKNAASAFHLSLGLDYPQAADLARARAGGYSAGGDIMIHGQPNSLPSDVVVNYDWTAGCIALSNVEIAEVFAAVKLGTQVEIRP